MEAVVLLQLYESIAWKTIAVELDLIIMILMMKAYSLEVGEVWEVLERLQLHVRAG